MGRPKCYIESPLGFSPMLEPVYTELIETVREVVEPINPFFIAKEEFIPGIMRASGEEREARWNAMALRLYRVIRGEADMGLAVLNGEDFGVGCELGYGFALHDTGYKKFPVVVFRDELLRAGETDNNLNAMVLPTYLETGGAFVSDKADLPAALAEIAIKLG
jgi:hypothetical protein